MKRLQIARVNIICEDCAIISSRKSRPYVHNHPKQLLTKIIQIMPLTQSVPP